MKKKLHLLVRGNGRVFFNTIIICFLSGMALNPLSAQTSEPASALISTEDLSPNAWKAPADYSVILEQERAIAAQQISNSNLNVETIALFAAYDRLLAYMQADLAVKSPIETIADINYKKVVLEAPTDPILKDADSGEFSVLYGSLVSKLAFQ